MSAPLLTAVAQAYAARFGAAPAATGHAPGRVNLMGEHTDYNGGQVLPVPLAMGIAVALGPSGQPGQARLASADFDGEAVRQMDEPAGGGWSDYAFGSLMAGARPALEATGLNVMIAGDLPAGAGLSSSAAIEVAVLRAAAALHGAQADPVATALQARAVENDYVGMPCGVMDQFAVAVGAPGAALLLDTATLAHRAIALPPAHRFAVIHSGVVHRLADDGYAARVRECAAASAALDVAQLCALDTGALDRIAALPETLARRARHVVSENARVTQAARALEVGDVAGLGAIMLESHASQRDDYAVSVPQVDALVRAACDAGALGARLTGGGFGGSVVALVSADGVRALGDAVTSRLPGTRVLTVI